MTRDIKVMLSYWPVLVIYQAVVLLVLVVYYFIVDSSLQVEEINNFIQKHVLIFQVLGFHKEEDIGWWEAFLPYVILFSLTIMLQNSFKEKICHESESELLQ